MSTFGEAFLSEGSDNTTALDRTDCPTCGGSAKECENSTVRASCCDDCNGTHKPWSGTAVWHEVGVISDWRDFDDLMFDAKEQYVAGYGVYGATLKQARSRSQAFWNTSPRSQFVRFLDPTQDFGYDQDDDPRL